MDSRSGKHRLADSEVAARKLGPVGNQDFVDILDSAVVLGDVDALDSVDTLHSCSEEDTRSVADSEEDIPDYVVGLGLTGVVEHLESAGTWRFADVLVLNELVAPDTWIEAHVLAYLAVLSHSNLKECSLMLVH